MPAATEAAAVGVVPARARRPGDLHGITGLLIYQVAQDLRRLVMINSFCVEDQGTGTMQAPRAYRLARGQEPYRSISYALVAPARRGTAAAPAEKLFARRYGGPRGLRDLDYALLGRLLGGHSQARGELLSLLLFDAEFVEALIERGRSDPLRWLRRHLRFWCRQASHDLTIDG